VVYIGISYSVDFIWDFPIVIGKPIHFGDSWLDPPVLLPSPYHNPRLDLFQIFYTLLTSLNVRISRGLEEFHSLNLAKSALVTRIRKDDWSRAARVKGLLSYRLTDLLNYRVTELPSYRVTELLDYRVTELLSY
jgi:hypothetical protein